MVASLETEFRPTTGLDLKWLFMLRNLIIAGTLVVIAITLFVPPLKIPIKPLLTVIAALLVVNGLTWFRIRAHHITSEPEFFFQLMLDVIAITAMLYFTGGATNPIAWIFLLPLIIAATVLPQLYTWMMAGLTTSCYTLLIWHYVPLSYLEMPDTDFSVPLPVMDIISYRAVDLQMFGMWFGFVLSTGIVIFFVVGMANSLRERDRKLAEAREHALRDERVIALGTLAAGAAHEIGTPLGTMAILAHELQQEYQGKEFCDLQDKMAILKEQIERCKQALSVMSASAGEVRAEEGHTMPLENYLGEVVKEWRRQWPKVQLRYQADGPQPAPSVVAERTLTHALVNVLNNAAEVSPKSVELKITWDVSHVVLEIRDCGPGVNQAMSKKLGKVPFTTKAQGLGVGLFLACATIHRLGGEIELLDQGGSGTCTRIQLPLLPHPR